MQRKEPLPRKYYLVTYNNGNGQWVRNTVPWTLVNTVEQLNSPNTTFNTYEVRVQGHRMFAGQFRPAETQDRAHGSISKPPKLLIILCMPAARAMRAGDPQQRACWVPPRARGRDGQRGRNFG